MGRARLERATSSLLLSRGSENQLAV